MRRRYSTLGSLVFLLLPSLAFSEVNFYIESVVKDRPAFRNTLGHWVSQNRASLDGLQINLMSLISNADTPSTNLVVVQMEGYQGVDQLQELAKVGQDQRIDYQLSQISSQHNEGHAVEMVTFGQESWTVGGSLSAIALHVTNTAAFKSAFETLMSSITPKPPGMVRLMRTLEGGKVTHYILVSADSFSELNRFLDEVRAAKAFQEFTDAAGKHYSVLAIRYLKVEERW